MELLDEKLEQQEKSSIKYLEEPTNLKSKRSKVHFDGEAKSRFARTERLAQPKQATQTYIHLLRDFAKFFDENRRLSIEKKISERSPRHSSFLDVRHYEEQAVEIERKKAIRKERKLKAARKQLNENRTDGIIQKILQKFAISINSLNPPTPMILGPNSRKLFDHIQSAILTTIATNQFKTTTEYPKEMVAKLAFGIMDFIRSTRIDILEPAKVENKVMNLSEIEVSVSRVASTEQTNGVKNIKNELSPVSDIDL